MRSRIGALQLGVADGQCSVGDLPAPFRRCILCHRRVAPSEHESDLAVQASFIEAKSGFAPAVKRKINTGIQLHEIHYRGRPPHSLVYMEVRWRFRPFPDRADDLTMTIASSIAILALCRIAPY